MPGCYGIRTDESQVSRPPSPSATFTWTAYTFDVSGTGRRYSCSQWKWRFARVQYVILMLSLETKLTTPVSAPGSVQSPSIVTRTVSASGVFVNLTLESTMLGATLLT